MINPINNPPSSASATSRAPSSPPAKNNPHQNVSQDAKKLNQLLEKGDKKSSPELKKPELKKPELKKNAHQEEMPQTMTQELKHKRHKHLEAQGQNVTPQGVLGQHPAHSPEPSHVENINKTQKIEMPHNISEVADRILVSSEKAHGGGEVRIKVESHLLPHTEIKLTQESGHLTVQMNTASPQALQMLGHEQHNLSQFLEQNSNFDVSIQLNYTGNQGEGDSSRRSKGLDLFGENEGNG